LLLSSLILPTARSAETFSEAIEDMVIEFSQPDGANNLKVIDQYSIELTNAFKRNNITEEQSFKISQLDVDDAYKISAVNFGAITAAEIIVLYNQHQVTDVNMIKELETAAMSYQRIRDWQSIGMTYFPMIKRHVESKIDYTAVKPWLQLGHKYTQSIELYDIGLFNSINLTPANYVEWVDFGITKMDQVILYKKNDVTIKELKEKNIKAGDYSEYKKLLSTDLSAPQLSEITNSFSKMKLYRFNLNLKKYPKATPAQIYDLMTNGLASTYKHWYNYGFYDPKEIRGYLKHDIFKKRGMENVSKVIRLTDNNFDLFWDFLKKNNISAKEALSYIKYSEQHPTFEIILQRKKEKTS